MGVDVYQVLSPNKKARMELEGHIPGKSHGPWLPERKTTFLLGRPSFSVAMSVFWWSNSHGKIGMIPSRELSSGNLTCNPKMDI